MHRAARSATGPLRRHELSAVHRVSQIAQLLGAYATHPFEAFRAACRGGCLRAARWLVATHPREIRVADECEQCDIPALLAGGGHHRMLLWAVARLRISADSVLNSGSDGIWRAALDAGRVGVLYTIAARFGGRVGQTTLREYIVRECAATGNIGCAAWVISTGWRAPDDEGVMDGHSLLARAAGGGHSNFIRWLVPRVGIVADDLWSDGDDEWSPFETACARGHFKTAKLLVTLFGTTVREAANSRALRLACEGSRPDIVRWLFRRFKLDASAWEFPRTKFQRAAAQRMCRFLSQS